jgi:hypothetical protein
MTACRIPLFGNPAIRRRCSRQRTRGFAPPDCPGFALIGELNILNLVFILPYLFITNILTSKYTTIAEEITALSILSILKTVAAFSPLFSRLLISWRFTISEITIITINVINLI